MARQITAQAHQTWDMLAKINNDFEYFAKDIMLLNPHLSDVVIFEGGENVTIPEDGDLTEEDLIELEDDEVWS